LPETWETPIGFFYTLEGLSKKYFIQVVKAKERSLTQGNRGKISLSTRKNHLYGTKLAPSIPKRIDLPYGIRAETEKLYS